MTLQFHQVGFSYGKRKILESISVKITQGEFVGILGPNGSGKTTLLKLASNILQPSQGQVLYHDKALSTYSRPEIARNITVLPQDETIAFPFKASEIVLMGRAPYLKSFAWESAEDLSIAQEAMLATDSLKFVDQNIEELSGGELKRVLLARALTQQPKILLLDEPINHLDLQHQVEILKLLQHLNKTRHITILMVIHDLNFAIRACHRVLLLNNTRIEADGAPLQVLTPKTVQKVFGVKVEVAKLPNREEGFIVPVG